MPARTREQRLLELAAFLDETSRYTSVAVQFEAFSRSDSGFSPTGRRSRVFGGVLDLWSGEYVDREPEPVVLPASEGQIDGLEDDAARVMGVGARGGGKSEWLKAVALAKMASQPGVNGQVVAPTFKLTRVVWGKLLADIPKHWIYQVRRADREIVLVNGVVVRFMSADNPDSLRGWGGAWSLHDESQDQPDEALDIAWLSLRETDTPQLAEAGTAKAGRFRDRYERLEESPDAAIHHFSALDNPFIPLAVYEHAARNMDARLYRQEVLAEWVGLSDVVYEWFERRRHVRKWDDRRAVLGGLYGVGDPDVGRDVTADVVRSRWKWESPVIVGLDYNISPMVAGIYRIARGPEGVGDIPWLCGEVILDDHASAERMGLALKQAGYPHALIVADASDSRAASYRRALKKAGHKVVNPARNNRNPEIKDRVAAMNALMLNANDETRWFCDPAAARIARALERQQRGPDGKPDKKSGDDHYCDAAGYPMVRLYPVAIESARTVTGAHAA